MRSNPGLWKRLTAHAFDASHGSKPFSAKLADEQGWSAEDTARVVEEYRRFLYLVVARKLDPVATAPVDAAWAMHLTYTRNYWEALVPDVLRGPVHRDGAAPVDLVRANASRKTLLAAYEQEFGETPPKDIWLRYGAWNWGGLVFVMIVVGVLGGLSSMAVFNAIGLSSLGNSFFLLFWALGFFSPLWAWLIMRRLPRLKTTKKRPTRTEFGVSFDND